MKLVEVVSDVTPIDHERFRSDKCSLFAAKADRVFVELLIT